MKAAAVAKTREGRRLRDAYRGERAWALWGPFLSERAWGTVREDYSADGDAWAYFPHGQARSRAYRWGEDGLAGVCDRHQTLCFALAFWNGRDPILKERAFGLSGHEGNHGEDVKEEYFYVDSTPTHSYLRWLYKYPQAAFPYAQLVSGNAGRGLEDREFELVDAGVFDEDRYFDIQAEYAKAAPDDIAIRVRVTNRGPEESAIHVLPTLWFRNTWSWGRDDRRPELEDAGAVAGVRTVRARHPDLGEYALLVRDADDLLFTENETNTRRLFGDAAGPPHAKDAFHDFVVGGVREAVHPGRKGTKAAAVHVLLLAPGQEAVLDMRLASGERARRGRPLAGVGRAIEARRREADEFYDALLPASLGEEARAVARQAFAGLGWSKQFYHYVVEDWLAGDPAQPPPPAARRKGRNADWTHLFNRDVVSVPDKWEFPWYASWDLAFQAVALAPFDPWFAKHQLVLMTREWYMHPNGQLPACEWNLGDVNPPVHAWAALRVARADAEQTGREDRAFLERVFHKLLLNFNWWVNRKDELGDNIFEGGFLGLDNIGAFNRSRPLPPGYLLGQADGTSWMAFYCQSMLGIALHLAAADPVYEDVASKFWEHFVYIGSAMNPHGEGDFRLWHEEDGFFYDVLRRPDGSREPMRARTVAGLIPLVGVVVEPRDMLDRHRVFRERRRWFLDHRPELTTSVAPMEEPGEQDRLLMSVVRPDQLRRILSRMLDEEEFLSPYGIRSVSRWHRDHPFVLRLGGSEHRLDYEPAEATTRLYGGNSNWRGPVWVPANYLLVEALRRYHAYYGDRFQVECPTGSGRRMNLGEVAEEIARRVTLLFLRGPDGRRPASGDHRLLQADPHWRDLVPFPEYFHGETGRGCGASHQTGWTALVADLLMRGAQGREGARGR